MQVKQIYELVNGVTTEILGKSDLIQEDLTNIVDVGKELFDTTSVDNYVKKLVNHIGKVIFVNRKYVGGAPSVLMDSWEFGAILEKISADLPTAKENASYNLVDGKSYDDNVFYQPKVTAKFFNSKVTFEIPLSFTEKQVKESFSSANQLNGFLSMLYNSVENALTVKIDSLIMRTINNAIGETLQSDLESDYTKTGVKAVNLLKLYNDSFADDLTANNCLQSPDFIRFASHTISKYKDRLSKISTLFNVGKKERFTSAEFLHIVLLSDFASATKVYLESTVYNNELLSLPKHETIPYWQSSGLNYSFEDISKINVKTSGGFDVVCGGILGVMFDRDAVGVCNTDRRVTTNYNAKAEFFTNYYKFDASYYNDLNENFVVFFVG